MATTPVEILRSVLPSIFFRAHLTTLTSGALNGRTIANLQSAGKGPPGFYCGKRMCFERESFLLWLEAYSTGCRTPSPSSASHGVTNSKA